MIKKILKLPLHYQILISMSLAIIISFSVNNAISNGYIEDNSFLKYFFPLGKLFIKSLKMIIIPLIFTSISLGVINLGGHSNLGRLSFKVISLFVITSFIAIFVGFVLVLYFQPGTYIDYGTVFKNVNPVKNAFEAIKDKSFFGLLINLTNDFIPENFVNSFGNNNQALAVIFISIIFGLSVNTLKKEMKNKIAELIEILNEIVSKIVETVIKFAPLGIFGLILEAISGMGVEFFRSLGMFYLTVILAITLHLFIILPLLYLIITGKNPIKHFKNMLPANIMAFSTSSSGATLPVNMKCLRENVGVSEKITSFVLPLGATVNMNGTALYECISVIFITQILKLNLDISSQIMLIITAFFAAVGTAAVPSAGLVMIFIIISAIGLGNDPRVGVIIGGILAVDRPLDMYRTVANVYSDSIVATIVAKSEGEVIK